MNALEIAIKASGTQQALAEALGLKQPAIANWINRGRVPANRCIDVEKAVQGKVTRYQLRPDIFGNGAT